ncbi:MarR family transcriptional regulator [marine bacterium AO1-C]|nr:MarR family transcriptional regulator [marine bacterium AO1-C]
MGSFDKEFKGKIIDDKDKFLVNLSFTSNWIASKYTDFLKPFDLSTQQFNILRILRGAKDWLAMSLVKERMVDKAPNTTRLADKLTAKGLVERRRSEDDRRVVYVKITEKGLELLKEIDVLNIDYKSTIVDRVTKEEAKMVNKILDRLRG